MSTKREIICINGIHKLDPPSPPFPEGKFLDTSPLYQLLFLPSDIFIMVITITRLVLVPIYVNVLLRTISCIPCVVSFASDLCVQSFFPLPVAQISACLPTPFLTPGLEARG